MIGKGTFSLKRARLILHENLCCTVALIRDLKLSIYGDVIQKTNLGNSGHYKRFI